VANLEKLVVQLRADNADLKKKLGQSTKHVNSFSSNMSKLGGVIAGAFAVQQIAAFGKEAFKLAEKAKGIETAFKGLHNSNALINDLTRATGGAISELELMQRAVQAVNLGIDQNQLAKFFEFATIRAAETGESIDYLVNSIVTGVGRGSVMILDNLGISTQQLGAGFASAGNKAEIVAGVIDKQLSASNLSIQDAAKSSDKLSAAFADLQLTMGKLVSGEGSGFLDFLTDVVKSFDAAFTGAEKLREQVWLDQLSSSGQNAVNELKDLMKIQERLTGTQQDLTTSADKFIATLESAKLDAIGDFGNIDKANIFQAQINAIKEYSKLFAKQQEEENKQLSVIKTIEKEIERLTALKEDSFNKAEIAEYNIELEKLKNKLDEINNLGLVTARVKLEAPSVSGIGVDEIIKESDLDAIEKFNTLSAKMAANVKGVNFEVERLPHLFENMAGFINASGEAVLKTGEIMTVFATETLITFAEGVGVALQSGNWANFGDTILKSVAGFMGKLGQQMIALGIAKFNFDTLLKSFGGGPVLIAAGVALVAASAAVSNSMSSASMGSASSSAGPGSAVSGNTGQYSGLGFERNTDPVTVNIVGKISGQDIIFSQEKTNRYNGIRG
jgi:hypothetical protein